MAKLTVKELQVSRHRKCRRIALVDVTSAPNTATQTQLGVADRRAQQMCSGQEQSGKLYAAVST
jgi:hypothetical protein